ncbi:unnamed protein product [Mytilus edulis]|uniref:Uncharacterized protein n=1 Tax=Mytilus edulis TaxID=6550 RepID=A0A8S3SCQ9_MYTED|nr:unnamed protein product [Mytilus edulis]
MEQNIKELQHTIETEAEEDQTYHVETKTKDTKLHVESAVEDNHTQTERISEKKNSEKNEPDRSNNNIKSYAGVRNQPLRKENSHHRDTYDLLTIGSSIIKDIDGKRLYKNRKVKVITLHGKTVFGAIHIYQLMSTMPRMSVRSPQFGGRRIFRKLSSINLEHALEPSGRSVRVSNISLMYATRLVIVDRISSQHSAVTRAARDRFIRYFSGA